MMQEMILVSSMSQVMVLGGSVGHGKGRGTQAELSGLPELRGQNRERSGKLELAGL